MLADTDPVKTYETMAGFFLCSWFWQIVRRLVFPYFGGSKGQCFAPGVFAAHRFGPLLWWRTRDVVNPAIPATCAASNGAGWTTEKQAMVAIFFYLFYSKSAVTCRSFRSEVAKKKPKEAEWEAKFRPRSCRPVISCQVVLPLILMAQKSLSRILWFLV